MDEVRKKENVLELQREIIEGISKDYFSVLLVDLENGQIYSYREAGSNGKRIADFVGLIMIVGLNCYRLMPKIWFRMLQEKIF